MSVGLEMIKLLLEERLEEVTAVMREDGEDICHIAASCGHTDILELLCRQQQFLPLREEWTAVARLCNAAYDGDAETVKELLLGGVYPDTKDSKFGGTPMSMAAALDNLEVVEVLLATDEVDVDSLDVDGRSPLFYSCEFGCERIVEMLLQAGADPTIEDYDGQTPLSIAKEWGHDRVVQTLELWFIEKGIEPRSFGHYKVVLGTWSMTTDKLGNI